MTKYSAKISYLPGSSAPDDYDPAFSRIPGDDFVVARRADGSVASVYGDQCWDRSAYSPDERCEKLYFDFWEDEKELTIQRLRLISEMKWLMFILIYMRPGHALAFKTLSTYSTTLRSIAKYCDLNFLRVQDVLNSPDLSTKFQEADATGRTTASLQGILRILGPQIVGFAVPNTTDIQRIKTFALDFRAEIKQHPPIPTRIYSSILSAQAGLLARLAVHLDDALKLAKECLDDAVLGRGMTGQKLHKNRNTSIASNKQPRFEDLLIKHGLGELWQWRQYDVSRMGLRSYLIDVLFLVALQVLAYTGMRKSEVAALPYDCLDEVDRDGTVHYVVKGRVTKLTKGKVKCVQWVTNVSGREAILVAQRIAKFIYMAKGTPPREDIKDTDKFYLFISPAYMDGIRVGRNTHMDMAFGAHTEVRDRIVPEITKDDLYELALIDPHRNWGGEGRFRLGQQWPLSTHQYRRSLALYAQRSGLVSLPSLKRQLQQITLEMAQYYAKGSGFAIDFIGKSHNDKHFGEEWQETQPVSQYLSYAANVLLENDENLFGGHAQWVRARLKKNDGLLLESRETTMVRFRKGEMAYTPTPVGGCTNPGSCDKNPIDVLHIECVAENCKHLVGNFAKTERVIKIKSRELEALRKSSSNLPELVHEEAEFKKLLNGFAVAQESRARGLRG